MKHLPVALATAAVTALAIPVAASAQQVEIEAAGPVIELSVYESVDAEPDLVTLGAGVTSDARTAVEAMRLNAGEMRKVIDRILALGIDEEDVQTTGINLNARYDYNRSTQRNVFVGYQASNRVSVRLREVERTGLVLDALVAAGATDLNGPIFSIEDDAAAKDEARATAVKRAQMRAEAYAALYGYGGVRVLAVSEAIQGRSPGPQPQMRMMAADAVEESAPVQPGMVSTGVNVTIKYEMTGGPAN
ncbi:MAG: SIMPL domain-containing protein [Erythrobacter sp.]